MRFFEPATTPFNPFQQIMKILQFRQIPHSSFLHIPPIQRFPIQIKKFKSDIRIGEYRRLFTSYLWH